MKKFKLPVTFAYTRTQAQFLETFDSQDTIWGQVEKGDFMPNVPKHLLRASVGVEGEPAGGAIAVTYMSKDRRRQHGCGRRPSELFTDAQTLVDASAWAKVWGPFESTPRPRTYSTQSTWYPIAPSARARTRRDGCTWA